VERVHRTVRDKLYLIFTFRNSYGYIDILPKFVKAYNDTVHTNTGMAPSRVTNAEVLAIWRRMEAKRQRVRVATAKFLVGKHVPAYQQREKEVCRKHF
jgi:hypothetical protein